MSGRSVIRQSPRIRAAIWIFSGVLSTQIGVAIAVTVEYPVPHVWAYWIINIASLSLFLGMPLRLSRLVVRPSGDVLLVRNSLRTYRLRRPEIAAIETRPVGDGLGGDPSRRRVAWAVLHSGDDIRLEALGSRMWDKERFDMLVAELQGWLEHASPHRPFKRTVHASARRRRLTSGVALGGLAVCACLAAMVLGDVAALQGSIPLMRVALGALLVLTFVCTVGMLVIAHRRGDIGGSEA